MRVTLVCLGFCLTHLFLLGAELSRETLEFPKGLPADMAAVLNGPRFQVFQKGKETYRFWIRDPIPVKSTPEDSQSALNGIRETTLLGLVQVLKQGRDYRDDDLFDDVYTMRFAFRPQDGNHLGSSDYLFFAVLVPLEKDRGLDSIKSYRDLTDVSGEDTLSEHPVILSLRPSDPLGDGQPFIREPAPDHKSVVLNVGFMVEGETENTRQPFEIVFEGHSSH